MSSANGTWTGEEQDDEERRSVAAPQEQRCASASAHKRRNGGLRPSQIRAFALRASMRVYLLCGLSLATGWSSELSEVEMSTREENEIGKKLEYKVSINS